MFLPSAVLFHNGTGVCAVAEQRGHGSHGLFRVFKESLKAAAQPVQSRFSVGRCKQPVFRTFSVAGKQEPALPTTAGQRSRFISAEGALLL
jgi:hypothetical protein